MPEDSVTILFTGKILFTFEDFSGYRTTKEFGRAEQRTYSLFCWAFLSVQKEKYLSTLKNNYEKE